MTNENFLVFSPESVGRRGLLPVIRIKETPQGARIALTAAIKRSLTPTKVEGHGYRPEGAFLQVLVDVPNHELAIRQVPEGSQAAIRVNITHASSPEFAAGDLIKITGIRPGRYEAEHRRIGDEWAWIIDWEKPLPEVPKAGPSDEA
jgi:hypothetical protein